MNLEDKLAAIKSSNLWAYRIIRSDGKLLGLLRSPKLCYETQHRISTKEFRTDFHNIMKEMEKGSMDGYAIFMGDEPVACLFSKNRHIKVMEDGLELIEMLLTGEGHLQSGRSRLANFFGRFSRKKKAS